MTPTPQHALVRAGLGSLALSLLALVATASDGESPGRKGLAGEKLGPEAFGPSVVESLDAVLERERKRAADTTIHGLRNGAHGSWSVPTPGGTFYPHSGVHYVTNKWGDTRMGVAFGGTVDLEGAWFAGQGAPGAWAPAVRVVGYRGDVEVGRTDWFEDVDDESSWFAIGLDGVDRVEVLARPAVNGGGFYALDDLTFRRGSERIVLDFEDLAYHMSMTDSNYGGITWETGTGVFENQVRDMPPPVVPPGHEKDPRPSEETSFLGGAGTAPTPVIDFIGPSLCEPGACWIPPDTCGAVGTDHFVAVVNQRMTIHDKSDGSLAASFAVDSFFNTGGYAGDSRIAFDHGTGRWILISDDFDTGIWFAFSATSNPAGSWFKTFITLTQGSDAGLFPDYPTLGFDDDGIYVGLAMFGGNVTHSLFAIQKAPLLNAGPSLGTVTAWRQLPFEGAIQPCVTHGSPPGEYVVSVLDSNELRLRRVDGPLTAPSLVELGSVSIPFHSDPPLAPAMGSSVDINTVGSRLMNAVYRNGSVWTAHAIDVSGRAACRWYEIDASSVSTAQVGTVSDSTRSYFFPGIAVNATNDVLLGCSGSKSSEFVGAWVTGRASTDPAGQMASPSLLRAGAASYELVDNSGRNRWGDYSLSSIDPDDDSTLWTIQEYARSEGDTWGTWIGAFQYEVGPSELGTRYCSPGVPNTSGQPGHMVVFGSDVVTNDNLTLIASQLPTSSNIGYFVMGQGTNVFTPPGSAGPLCVTPGLLRYLPPVSNTNEAPGGFERNVGTSGPVSGLITAGSTWNFQAWHRDGMGPSNLTDAVSVTFQ